MADRTFCTKCGARLKPGASFCTACGAAQAPAAAPGAPAPAPAAAPAPAPARSAVARATSVAGTAATVAGRGQAAFAMATALPWTTVKGSQPIDTKALIAAAAPSLVAALPRPNLRWPALSILVTLAMDVGIALLRGGLIAWPLLGMRLLTGIATSLLGIVSGSGGGTVRKLTGIASVVFGVVQLVSLLAGALAVARTPVQLLPLLPGLIAVTSGLVLSISTAIGAWRK